MAIFLRIYVLSLFLVNKLDDFLENQFTIIFLHKLAVCILSQIQSCFKLQFMTSFAIFRLFWRIHGYCPSSVPFVSFENGFFEKLLFRDVHFHDCLDLPTVSFLISHLATADATALMKKCDTFGKKFCQVSTRKETFVVEDKKMGASFQMRLRWRSIC
jgi:hypothetical protein